MTAVEHRPRLQRIAQALWIVWSVVVWNVVFDYVIVAAGREYLNAAMSAAVAGPYARMDDWMGPAIVRGLLAATTASAVILLVGLAAIRVASRNRGSRRRKPGPPEDALYG
jgi:hypothetical protein